MNIMIGLCAIIIGIINTVVIGFMGITFGPWNSKFREKHSAVYKWMSVVSGIIVMIIGVYYLFVI